MTTFRFKFDDIQPYLTNAKQKGTQIVCACPICEAGESKGHHLYVKPADDGEFTAYCQKCNAPFKDYLQAWRDMGAKPSQPEYVKPVTPKDKLTVIETREHKYRYPDGSMAYIKHGKKYADGSKNFGFVYLDDSKTPVWEQPPDSIKLYNLDKLEQADPATTLYIVEGEKCVDKMAEHGLLATTSNTGAQHEIKLSDMDKEMLAKFPNKVVIPDNDEKGEQYAKAWECPQVIDMKKLWPECPRKGDIADYLDAGLPIEPIIHYFDNIPKPVDKYSVDFFEGLEEKDLLDPRLLDNIYALPVKERAVAEAFLELRVRALSLTNIFNKFRKAYLNDRQAKAAKDKRENLTAYSLGNHPAQLNCCEYTCDDMGVRRVLPNGELEYICRTPITISERLVNVEDGTEKVRVAFFKDGIWKSRLYPVETIASFSKIIRTANDGVPVSNDNAKSLIRFLCSVLLEHNKDILVEHKSISHLGWHDGAFVPYDETYKLDAEASEAEGIINGVSQKGSLEEWVAYMQPLWTHNIFMRLMLDASFCSPLLGKLNILPFIVHLHGTTGSGKSVLLKCAASVWGNPSNGKMLRSLNSTINAMMGNAAVLCNLPFFGDELQTIKNRYDNYDVLIMQICEGLDRGRMNADASLKKQASWANVFMFTGEEPCTQPSSGGGVKNRVLEIECDDKIIEDGHGVVEFISGHYGEAGKEFIRLISQELDTNFLREQYRYCVRQILKCTDTTDKQAMAMAAILTADIVLASSFFDCEALDAEQVKRFLKTKEEVDPAERAYRMVMDLIAENEAKFSSSSDFGGAVWGKAWSDKIYFNKSVLEREMSKMGFSFNAVKKKWAQKGYINNYDGRCSRIETLNSVRTRCVCFPVM